MNTKLDYLYQEDEQEVSPIPEFKKLMWQDISDQPQNLNEAFLKKEITAPETLFYQNIQEIDQEDNYLKDLSYFHISFINNINQNIETHQHFSIPNVEVKSANYSFNNEDKNQDLETNKSSLDGETNVKKQKITKLHEDIYSNDSFIQTFSLNSFTRLSTFAIFSIILGIVVFPSQTPSNSSNVVELISQPNINTQSNSLETILNSNNLAEITLNTPKKTEINENIDNITPENQPNITNQPNTEKSENIQKNLIPPPNPNQEKSIIVDRYYISQNNDSKSVDQNTLTIVDRYYLPNNYIHNYAPNPVTQNPTINTNYVNPKPKTNITPLGDLLPPPPPPEINQISSIPSFSDNQTTNYNNSSVANNSDPNQTYTLKGIMSFAENSAALFSIGDTVLRVKPGEQINVNGWTLDNLENGQATLKKQGENLHLRVGQSFSTP
jgi:hypothetical protein